MKKFKRVINILMNHVQNNQEFHQSIINNSLLIDTNVIDETTSLQDSLTRGLNNSFKVQLSLNNDINSMFLSILESYISQSEYREELIKIKYTIATTNKSLEQLIIGNRFDIPNTIFIGAKFMNELLQESKLSYEIIRFAELKTKAQMEINKLIQIKDSEYSNLSTNIDSIISSCYLRALLSLMSDEDVRNLEKEFELQTEMPEYMYKHLHNQISENIILNCFKSFECDKEKTRILTTKANT